MPQVNNYHGYILMVGEQVENSDGVSNVIGKPRAQWHTLEPMVIYPSPQALIDAVPDFNKRTHIIGEVIVHLLSERVEIISYEPRQKAG